MLIPGIIDVCVLSRVVTEVSRSLVLFSAVDHDAASTRTRGRAARSVFTIHMRSASRTHSAFEDESTLIPKGNHHLSECNFFDVSILTLNDHRIVDPQWLDH